MATKSKGYGYPKELKTLGDRIRAKRIDEGLLQRDVAGIIGVCAETVLHWEKNQNFPSTKFHPKIMEFLGYCSY